MRQLHIHNKRVEVHGLSRRLVMIPFALPTLPPRSAGTHAASRTAPGWRWVCLLLRLLEGTRLNRPKFGYNEFPQFVNSSLFAERVKGN